MTKMGDPFEYNTMYMTLMPGTVEDAVSLNIVAHNMPCPAKSTVLLPVCVLPWVWYHNSGVAEKSVTLV